MKNIPLKVDGSGMRIRFIEFVVVLFVIYVFVVGCMMRCLILLMIYFRVLFYVNF